MVWMVMATVVAISSTLLYFLYKHSVPASPHSRWPPSMHFTIPILSPFASVIEHETSAVNVQLVAVLMLAACIFAFLWFRCPPWRR
ncbi:hypothetical protein C2E23DRAFT_564959 [Lenzites betulinus]|nr:hypothetical protein C2E23DRAFT_564959 [Lenzites betulinus]